MADTKKVTGGLLIATPIAVIVSIFVLVLFFMTGGSSSAACAGGVGSVDPEEIPTEPVAGYTGEQLRNAALIMNAAVPLGLERQAQVVAVMTAMGESSLRNIDYGDDINGVTNPDGSSTCSLGLFQQQWCLGSWGTRDQVMDPTYAATEFLKRLAAVPDWGTLEPSIAAHKVQRNADPFHYERYFDAANQVVIALAGGAGGCNASGALRFPLSEGYNMTSGFGPRDINIPGAPSWHAAVDLQRWPNPCGDQIYSISAGTVTYKAGYQLTIKSPEGWSVSYLHMRMPDVSVEVGETVTAGQPIALVGNEGPSGGCHLDFRINQIGSTDAGVLGLPDAVSKGSPVRYAGFVHPEDFYELFGMDLCPPASCERQG